MRDIKDYLDSGEYLPVFMRDFHDQKDVFKFLDHRFRRNKPETRIRRIPSWVEANIYVIDCFLWFMALWGYTLQKSRKRVNFQEMPNFYRENMKQLGPLPSSPTPAPDTPKTGVAAKASKGSKDGGPVERDGD